MAKQFYQPISRINILTVYPHPIVSVQYLSRPNYQQDEKPVRGDALLNEDGSYILNEDGSRISLE